MKYTIEISYDSATNKVRVYVKSSNLLHIEELSTTLVNAFHVIKENLDVDGYFNPTTKIVLDTNYSN